MPRIIPVAEWGGTKPDMSDKFVPLSQRTEFFVHYDGGVPVTRTGYSIPQAITRYHVETRGWVFAGYNYVIESNPNSVSDGAIYELRGRDVQGAHCPNHNITGIGVQVAIGADQLPTEKALTSLVWLYNEINKAAGKTLEKKGHRDGKATLCPGEHLYYFVRSGFDIQKTISAGHAANNMPDEVVVVPTEGGRNETAAEFIARVVPMAQQVQRTFYVPASVCIAQAALETGWGKSVLAQKAFNYFGIKNRAVASTYQSGTYSKETLEYYDNATTPSTEVALFRAYPSVLNSFLDYGAFLFDNLRYWGAFRHQVDPAKFIGEVKAAGYATDPEYVSKLTGIIEKYDLTQYDLLRMAGTSEIPSPDVQETEEGTTPAPTPTPSDTTDRHIPTTQPYTDTLTLQRLVKAATTEVLTGEDYNHRLQAMALLVKAKLATRMVPEIGEKWVTLFTTSWKRWQESLGFTGIDADGIPGPRSVYELATKNGLKYWDSVTNSNTIAQDSPVSDGTDRHIPTSYPYTDTLTLQRLIKASNTEVLTGEDYNHRLQALTSLKTLGIAARNIPEQGEKWVTLFKASWSKWQSSLGYVGSDADGVPGEKSVIALAEKAGLKYWNSAAATASPTPPSDGTDRHIPATYPYTDTLTLQRLIKASNTEVLTGEDYNHRLQALTSLKALGHTTRQVPAQGEKWVTLFKTAWRKWQESLGYVGSGADGVPGATSVYTLATRVGLKYWNSETNSSTLTAKAPTTSPGLPNTGASGLVNPTKGGRITTPFGKYPNNSSYWQAFGRHTGADFSRSSASSADLYAVSSGTITYKWSGTLGHIAILKADSLAGKSHQYFWYCHLASKPVTGRVAKGQRIGTMGATGSGANGVHLHLELQKSGTRWGTAWSDFTNPAPYVRQG